MNNFNNQSKKLGFPLLFNLLIWWGGRAPKGDGGQSSLLAHSIYLLGGGGLDGGLISRAPKGDGGLNSRAC